MLFTYCALDEEEQRVEAATTRIRQDLRRYVVLEPRRWTGLLARMTRARALAGSNRVEGINVSDEDAIAAIDGEDPVSTDRDTWRAVVGYREAMDYILQRRQSPTFRISEDVLLAVHFMICQSVLPARPGQYRPGLGWRQGLNNRRTGARGYRSRSIGAPNPRPSGLRKRCERGVSLPARRHDPPEPGNAASIHGWERTNGQMHPHRGAGERRERRADILINRRVRRTQSAGVLQHIGRGWRRLLATGAQRQAVGSFLSARSLPQAQHSFDECAKRRGCTSNSRPWWKPMDFRSVRRWRCSTRHLAAG